MADNPKEVQIADVIEAVRAQLIESEKRRLKDGIAPLFQVDSLEIDVRVMLRHKKTSKGKIDIKLVAIGADTEVEQERTHSVKLRLAGVETDDSQRGKSGRASGLRPSVKRGESA